MCVLNNVMRTPANILDQLQFNVLLNQLPNTNNYISQKFHLIPQQGEPIFIVTKKITAVSS